MKAWAKFSHATDNTLETHDNTRSTDEAVLARQIARELAAEPLFKDQSWHTALRPLELPQKTIEQIEFLGRVLLKFVQVANRLYFGSVEGKYPRWVHEWLDRGKPDWLIEIQRREAARTETPRVIRPDLVLRENGLCLVELDSVPGGIGATAWLNQRYASAGFPVVGGAKGMLEGFAGIFPPEKPVTIVVSEECRNYLPEMEWLCTQLGSRFQIAFPAAPKPEARAIYRFFELFDVPNIPGAQALLERAGEVFITPPPKPLLEEKMLLALFWNRHLAGFWREQLGEGFDRRLREVIPYGWVVDPALLPAHGVIPRLELASMHELGALSKRERRLVLKVSGFSAEAWGGRGVYMGEDLSTAEWQQAVQQALDAAPVSPYILQEYGAPVRVSLPRLDAQSDAAAEFAGHARLSPYFFVSGDGNDMRTRLGGILATVCPLDKKKIHGMRDAVMAPVMAAAPAG